MRTLTASLRGALGGRPSRAASAASKKWNKAFETLGHEFPGAFDMDEAKVRAIIVALAQAPGLRRFVDRLREEESDGPAAKSLPTPEEMAYSLAFELQGLGARNPATVRAMAERLLQIWPQPTAAIRACDPAIDAVLADLFLMKKGYFDSFGEAEGDDVIRVFLSGMDSYVDINAKEDKRLDVRVNRRRVESGFFRRAHDYYLQEPGVSLARPGGEANPWLKMAFRHRRQHCESGLFYGEDEEAFEEATATAEETGSKTIWQRLLGLTGRELVWAQ